MENKTNEASLEQIRSQLAVLKRKLDSQQIVNDRLIRTAMQSSMGWISRLVDVEKYVLLPLVVIVFILVTVILGTSWWFFAFTVLLVAADVVADHKINVVADSFWQGGSMVDVRRRLVRMKELRRQQLLISLPVLAVWVALLVLELMSACGFSPANGYPPAMVGGLAGGMVGLVGGVILAVIIIRKMQRTNDELIRQIDDLEAGN